MDTIFRIDEFMRICEEKSSFEIGDSVIVKTVDDMKRGIIVAIDGFDDILGEYKYKIRDEKRKIEVWSESFLRKK